MKLLLESSYRNWLDSRNALTIDDNFDERFAGLTHTESVRYASLLEMQYISFEHWTLSAITDFIEMYERHEQSVAYRATLHSLMDGR